MTHDKDKILLRAKDISLLVLVLTFLGLLTGPLKKVFKLDDMISKVERLEEKTYSNSENIAVIISQNKEIMEQMRMINSQLRRGNRRYSDGE